MSTSTDARPQFVAISAAIKATIGTAHVYDYGTVPGADGNAGSLPAIFVLLTVERRYNPNLRLSAQAGSTGWRVTARSVGRTANECRWADLQVAEALNERSLLIAGTSTTPIQFESERPPELDDGRFSALSVYTFAH